ncbi:MAG TPA: hypothetical protein VFJ82_26580 [Longimicrobium sp.]|nr:hypothetical protein [Longimicrobium sp.]
MTLLTLLALCEALRLLFVVRQRFSRLWYDHDGVPHLHPPLVILTTQPSRHGRSPEAAAHVRERTLFGRWCGQWDVRFQVERRLPCTSFVL